MEFFSDQQWKGFFFALHQLCHASNMLKKRRICHYTTSITKPSVWAFSSSCWKRTFPGTHKEQSQQVLYTPQTCRICYKNQQHYKSDNEVSSQQFWKTEVFPWPIVHQLCYTLNKPKTCRICYWHHKYFKTYTLSNCWMSTFPGTLKEQSPQALYTPQTCTICYRHGETVIYPTMKGVPFNSWKREFCRYPLWTNYATHRTSLRRAEYTIFARQYKKYGLCCLEHLVNIAFSRGLERVKVTIRWTRLKRAEFTTDTERTL